MNLKKAVAREVLEAVRQRFTSASVAQHVTTGPPAKIESVEITGIADLAFEVRVKTQNTGTHYFTVRVSEMQ